MSKTVDQRVYDLAWDWLNGYSDTTPSSDVDVYGLAAAIQQTIEDWCEDQDRAAEQADDPHERAAAKARTNNFEQTGGKDWT